jgi:hypothetical protein
MTAPLTPVYSAIGGHHLEIPALLDAFGAWSALEHVEPLDERPAPREAPIVSISEATDRYRGAWLLLREPRSGVHGPLDAIDLMREITSSVARALGARCELLVSGATESGPGVCWLDYLAMVAEPTGALSHFEQPDADAWMRRYNPVDDDCPYAEFHELLEALLARGPTSGEARADAPAPEYETMLGAAELELAPYYRIHPICDDRRVDALLREIRCGASFSTERGEGDRTVVRLELVEGGAQISYLSEEQAGLFLEHLPGWGHSPRQG